MFRPVFICTPIIKLVLLPAYERAVSQYHKAHTNHIRKSINQFPRVKVFEIINADEKLSFQ